ncbi:hypothetical protein ABVV53_04400 [Novosphingobium sp. RD2P27]|uniref:Uncharacterized protein n=1 Tax=Novosphingobium kalidii TaxID=3230299 RepID=A0ABV2CYM2_9SPHN
MTAVLSTLFILVGLGSIALIRIALVSNLSAVADLRHRARQPEYGTEVTVNFRNDFGELEPVGSMRRRRPARHLSPKPVTHRLHQFVKARSAA